MFSAKPVQESVSPVQVPEFLSHFLCVALRLSCFSVAWLKDGAGGDCRGPRRNADPPTTNAPLLLQLFNAGFSTNIPFHCSQEKGDRLNTYKILCFCV